MTLNIRKIGILSRTYRHINRYRQILTVLIKHGFEEFVEKLKIAQYIEIGLQRIAPSHVRTHEEVLTRAQRLRLVLEELGPTFIKLGQVASTRPDLIPQEFLTELEKLQQQVPPFPFDDVRRIIEAELHRPLDRVFARFDPTPLAAASIGQVHRAALLDGDEVVVKVQRPGIRSVIEVDLEILLHLATLVEKHVEGGKVQRPTRVVEEFARSIEQELDYLIEAKHLEKFAALFRTDETVYVPNVYREATTSRVLTIEYVAGIRSSDVAAIRAAGLDPVLITKRGADLLLRQIFVHGFFHADPHPGNIAILPGNVLCYYDFGMMGRIDRRMQDGITDLIHGVVRQDAPRTTKALLRVCERDEDVEPDLRRLERDVADFLDMHIVAHLKELQLSRLLRHLLDLVSAHRLRIPADIVLMLKALGSMEGLGHRLDPDFDMIAAARPYVQRRLMDRMRPRRIIRDLYESSAELIEVASEIPAGLRDILQQAKRGQLRIGFEHRGLERMLDSHEKISNRISFAIVVAALIVGSSVIVQSGIPPKWNEIPLIGLIGFLLAGVLGFSLLISILRHGRL